MRGWAAGCAASMALLLAVPAAAGAATQAPASSPAAKPARPASAKPAASARRALPANAQEARERVREATRGMASWYGGAFQGKRTASGEPFDLNEFTAAHPTLPFGTVVEVRSLANGRTVRVRINDRGPHTGNRVIDLSEAAARALGLHARGTKQVELKVLGNAAAPDEPSTPGAPIPPNTPARASRDEPPSR